MPTSRTRVQRLPDHYDAVWDQVHHGACCIDARLNFPSIKKTRARARHGVLENLSKPLCVPKIRFG